ncbi:hypothetical protein FB45DRAFT_917132 [Roridomyces roridus]|uniref:Pre-rRNA-processing protein n=1 Tax=Roridomyces roridus TaxID=1738132 RepID=A0AAD7FPS1_9AGAR|nr:hypothetical protein FB45DRAFT_917132 [Roridomyces roridus]
MPKSAKKRNEKAADFSKKKLKLGKGKQLASNAIDTSFKARSIALPSQSITADKDDSAPTTKRRLTFEDLVTHLKHYSPGTRKDALLGLRELLDAHPEILKPSLTTLVNATIRLVGDEEAAVRKALLEFFVWLFPRIPTEDLIPHSNSLLLFTTSAQTHIFPEIRVDAIRFLNLLLEYLPAATVSGWNQSGSENGSRVLEGYLGILSAGTRFGDAEGPMKATSTASVVLTPASKLVVLRSLSAFLRAAISSPSRASSSSCIDTWYLASWFQTQEAYGVFDQLFQPGTRPHRTWQCEVNLELDGDCPSHYPLASETFGSEWTLQQLSEIVDGTGSDGDNARFVQHLARTLHSTLVSTFLDCAPSVFSPNGNVDETQARSIVAVAEITRHLYGSILQSNLEKDTERRATSYADLKSILGYMSPYFPFKLIGTREIKRARSVQETKGGSLRAQTELVSNYVIQLLSGESLSTSQLGRPLTPSAYAALLPTIWALINNHSEDDVLQAVIDHATRVSSKSAAKQATVEFVGRLILVISGTKLAEWLNHLPKCLWELGSSNLGTTEIILRFLIVLCQRRAPLANPQTMASLRSQLVPYFSINHPVRGQMSGPYSKLPPSSPVRRLALDAVVSLMGNDSALSAAVTTAVEGTTEQSYWCNISAA